MTEFTNKYVVSVRTSQDINYLSNLLLVFNRRRIKVVDLNIYKVDNSNYIKFNIVFESDDLQANNVMKQINKLIEVEEVKLYFWDTIETKELGMFTLIKSQEHKKFVLKEVAKDYGAKLHEFEDVYILELTGSREELDELREELTAHHLIDFSYSGPIGVLNSNVRKELNI